jgi:ABC-type dipeptide/oligopeptide/nickel transport system permease component
VQAVSIAPVFLLAHVAVAALNGVAWAAMERGWIARPDWFALPDQPSALRTALAVVLLAVGSGALAGVHGEVEDALVRVRASPWVDAARARGEPTGAMVLRALAPELAGTAASRAALLVGGAVIVEKVLLLNGAGAVLWSAALLRDSELALSIGVLAAALVAAARLAADAVRVAIDPRLRRVP